MKSVEENIICQHQVGVRMGKATHERKDEICGMNHTFFSLLYRRPKKTSGVEGFRSIYGLEKAQDSMGGLVWFGWNNILYHTPQLS